MKNNESLLNLIAPTKLNINMNDVEIGENRYKFLVIHKYPPNLTIGWLGKINSIKGAMVKSIFMPKLQGELVSAISKNISNDRVKADSATDVHIRQIAERKAQDGEKILKQIDEQGESVGKIINIIVISGENLEKIKRIEEKVRNTVAMLGCSVRTFPAIQEELLNTVSPYNLVSEKIEELGGRAGLLSTFMGGIFNSTDGFNDNKGYYFAKDLSDNLMIMDIWKRGNDRTNSNMTILGKSGSGKSTAVKKIILNEFMMGTKIIIIDPEREYDELTKNLNGNIINLGGSSSGNILNPLEVNKINTNEGEYEDEIGQMSALSLHLQNLEIFFSLYLENITSRQKEILNKELRNLYSKFHIDWETDISNFRSEQFPEMTDLHNLLKEKYDEISERDYEELVLLLENATNGTDKFLFNGITKIKADKKIVCLDTHDLNNASDRVKKAQYFNVMNWAWKQVAKDRKEKTLVILDEAYLVIDNKIPQTLIGLKNMAKRCRKYESGVIVLSQSIIDFLAPEIKQHGQALLTQSCYKLFLGADGKDLQEITETFQLKEKHRDVVMGGIQGRGLMMVGSKYYIFNMVLTDYEIRAMGSKGGR